MGGGRNFLDGLDNVIAGKSPANHKPAFRDIDVNDLLTKMLGAISGQESRRSTDVNPDSGATGEFQVMPANIPAWTRKYLQRTMSVDEFRNDPVAQKKVFEGEMGSYLRNARRRGVDDDTAIRMGAAQWYGGPGAIDRYDDPAPQYANGRKYPSLREYTTSVLNRIRRGQTPDFLTGLDKILGPPTPKPPIDTGRFLRGLDNIIGKPPVNAPSPTVPTAPTAPTAPMKQRP